MTRKMFYLRVLCCKFVLGGANREAEWKRVLKYCLVGFIPFGANMLTMVILKSSGVDTQNAAVTAFFVGGQVSFWSHDRLTFGDRHVSLKGWRWRWAKFMPGQFAGFAANYFVVASLVKLDPVVVVLGFDVSLAFIYTCGLVCGIATTFSWTNFFSHKDDEDTTTQPDKAPCSVES